MSSRLLVSAIVASIALTISNAHAQRPDVAAPTSVQPTSLARPWTVAMEFGGGTPVGTTGIVVEHTPLSWLTLSAGAGLAQGKPQFSFIPRVTAPLTQTLGLGVGAGVSFGPSGYWGRDALHRLVCSSCGDVDEKSYSFASWANAELSLEDRRPWGLVWRVFVGGARVLNPSSGTCASSTCADHAVVAYLGVAVGWSFSL